MVCGPDLNLSGAVLICSGMASVSMIEPGFPSVFLDNCDSFVARKNPLFYSIQTSFHRLESL